MEAAAGTIKAGGRVICKKCGKPIVVTHGGFGLFYGRCERDGVYLVAEEDGVLLEGWVVAEVAEGATVE